MLLATALIFLLQDVLNRRLLFQILLLNATKETITHHFFVSGIGQKKTSIQPKFAGGAENVVKQNSSKHSAKWITPVLFTEHLYSAEA